ncbi:hypothetical protein [Colwellia sp. E2M01]|uniref:hypothetical protein n=1 Tax=Colwellia sp. E2M01 TaxID=2841561 RepID=UPI001C08878D|nr:hypothetical protein [Colwellia sp. E2M01]MBU2872050.1 hypothetical protein [Colwellia sp. E2M01]
MFLGKDKARHVVKADGFQPVQLPAEMTDADETLIITQTNATGWPEDRSVNGLYRLYGRWPMES